MVDAVGRAVDVFVIELGSIGCVAGGYQQRQGNGGYRSNYRGRGGRGGGGNRDGESTGVPRGGSYPRRNWVRSTRS